MEYKYFRYIVVVEVGIIAPDKFVHRLKWGTALQLCPKTGRYSRNWRFVIGRVDGAWASLPPKQSRPPLRALGQTSIKRNPSRVEQSREPRQCLS